ncbi:putative potassium transport system protein kup [Formosimonas limnophila]|uniref:Probable potassium transport system protein Kup n=1 Tax=Formosimonas limnophila TaxID=1384487 RepID=A0A8J3CFF1_9BURK|nr:potassium transporter Kup [Formosimonas limnophila]GHA64531.1 putative potassium transport system protein kup [Formosimonas limnophila]
MSQINDPHKQALHALALGALGIVFGDIGTSPLYAMKESLGGHYGLTTDAATIMGVLSLMFWSAILVVSIKYVTFIMKADNKGEGGILALMALTLRGKEGNAKYRWVLVLGILGASMFYGDSVITPAISILSAVEGLEVVAPSLHEYILPIALIIITGLFLIQKHGTGAIGVLFGPVCALWFLSLGALGVYHIIQNPAILAALSPHHAVSFFMDYQVKALMVMGSVFLVVTGGEALYADMGHFGRKPIILAWYALVFPALMLNYFGQGAFILSDVAGAKNPFFMMVPSRGVLPMVILATLATIIASQAVISGAFSLTSAAMKLGYCPRLKIVHTNEKEKGQIYVPFVNWFLWALVVFAVLYFKTSSNLAAAYGIAVTTTMLIDDVLLLVVMLTVWRWSKPVAWLLFAAFVVVDGMFFGANVIKFTHGGWFPAVLGAAIFIVLMTWKRGKDLVHDRTEGVNLPLVPFMQSLLEHPPTRVEGTAMFMHADLSNVPNSLLHNLKHNRVLHERIVFLGIHTEDVPYIADEAKIHIDEIADNVYVVNGHYGFKDEPIMAEIMGLCAHQNLNLEMMDTSFFLNRETVIPSKLKGMAIWRERMFALMMRNSVRATDYFQIPPNRVVEMGTQVEI